MDLASRHESGYLRIPFVLQDRIGKRGLSTGELLRLVLACLVLALCISSKAQVTFSKVMADGDVEPSSGGTITLNSCSGAVGNIWITTTLAGPGINSANNSTYFYGALSAPQMLYREGQILPGFTGELIEEVEGHVGPGGSYGA